MNVLIVNGSPRKQGNTAAALRILETELKKRHTVETVNAVELSLKGCINCDGCKRNGGICVLKDDGAAFMEKVEKADCVIFGSPVYWWGITGQLKLALDKFYSKNDEFHQMKKLLGIVAIGGADGADPEYKLISDQFHCIADFLGWKVVLDISIADAVAADSVAKDERQIAKLRAAAKSL